MNETRDIDPTLANRADVQVTLLENTAGLPVAVPPSSRVRKKWRKRSIGVLIVSLIALVGAAGGTYWWTHRPPQLPDGIAFGNGRIEADPIDIDTKFAGRVFELRVDEGDMVRAGQVLAVMDTRDLAQSLRKAEAQVELAKRAISEAEENAVVLRTQVVLAQQEIDRTNTLVKNGWATKELLDQRQQKLDGARAAERAGVARLNEAHHAFDAATHDAELYRVNIADNTLIAPRDGRIEYRVANVGEVVPAGGKIFTMLDINYVYMDIYLPTLTAGRIKIGDDARIVLDAYPESPIPAKVTFIASQAQFTPKMVETQTERDKLMFRIRVRIDPEHLRAHAASMRSGLPGVAYVRFDTKATWPERLQGKS